MQAMYSFIKNMMSSKLMRYYSQIYRPFPAEPDIILAMARGHTVKSVTNNQKVSVNPVSARKREACRKPGVKTGVMLIRGRSLLKSLPVKDNPDRSAYLFRMSTGDDSSGSTLNDAPEIKRRFPHVPE
ncbi:TPA: hypothetical protein ACY3HI_004737 [Citrobacter braakii]